MRQTRFENHGQKEWREFEALLDQLEAPGKIDDDDRADFEKLPFLYRRICGQYSLALRRRYTSGLTEYLHALVLRGHRLVYQSRGQSLAKVFSFVHHKFPAQVRQARVYVFICLFCFLVPALISGLLAYRDQSFIYTLMSDSEVRTYEKAYARRPQRGAENDFAMFGFYIQHNVSIDLRAFGSGLLFGVSAFIIIAYNGMSLGGVAGHLSHAPYAGNFWPFVSGHSSWELTAMVLAGASGMMLGFALLHPGPYRRLDALKLAAPRALQIILGAALMTIIAACIEGFWSASSVPNAGKYAFSFANWGLVLGYLCLCGRGCDAA